MALNSLLRLPTELRLMIWDSALVRDKPLSICDPEDDAALPRLDKIPEALHQECLARYCQRNSFIFEVAHLGGPTPGGQCNVVELAANAASEWFSLVGTQVQNIKRIHLRQVDDPEIRPLESWHHDPDQRLLKYWGLKSGQTVHLSFEVELTKEAPGYRIAVWSSTETGETQKYSVNEAIVNLAATAKYYSSASGKLCQRTRFGTQLEAEKLIMRYGSIKFVMDYLVSDVPDNKQSDGFTKNGILRLLDTYQGPKCTLSKQGRWRLEEVFSRTLITAVLNFDESDKPSLDQSFDAEDPKLLVKPETLYLCASFFARRIERSCRGICSWE